MQSLKRFTERYPVLFSLIVILVALYGPRFVLPRSLLSMEVRQFGAVGLRALLASLLIHGFGWWREAGFTPPFRWQAFRAYWPLAIQPAIVFALSLPAAESPWQVLLFIPFSFLVGFSEEALVRGLVLRALQPLGAIRAVLLSSFIFGFAHLSNLEAGLPFYVVLLQCLSGSLISMGWAGSRLRAGTIWPAVIIHMVQDLGGFLKHGFSGMPTPSEVDLLAVVIGSVLYLPYALYGLYQARKHAAASSGPIDDLAVSP
jgi:membrane protease YdiL (CAAX protease family)